MAEKKLVDQLFRRLTEDALNALEGAVQECKLRGHRHVELAHWLHNLLQLPNSDLHRIISFFQISPTALDQQVQHAIEAISGGYRSAPVVAGPVRDLVHDAWVQATARFGDDRIRSGHLILAALYDTDLSEILLQTVPAMEKVSAETLAAKFDEATAGSPEASGVAGGAGSPDLTGLPTLPSPTKDPTRGNKGGPPPVVGPRSDALAKFTEDLTLKAREGRIDPVVGRDDEIRQVIDILMRRRQNNPILTGEAGVGKTAVVEGFALRLASGDVPPLLRGATLRSLDLAQMQAGAGVRGEFENRLKQLIEEVKSSGNTIVFIDEAHTLIGAGGSAGQGDAANLLKPALARGELRTIAATTADEYRKHIESDPALKRRFQEVMVNEPSEEKTVRMLRSLTRVLEKHHGVLVFEDAVAAAATLSGRYIPSRQLPDKAVAVLDTACARVALSQHGTPGPVEDLRRHIQGLKSELENVAREQNFGAKHEDKARKIQEDITASENSLKTLEARWTDEKKIVSEIDATRLALDRTTADKSTREKLQSDLRAAEASLATLQGDLPLVRPRVDAHAVGSVVADWTGIPVGRMVKNEIQAALNLPQLLGTRVVGQDHALELIARHIRTAQAQLKEPNKPLGSFLLIGPSGTGKTETALALAEARYGSERNLIVFNMNEFKEEHTVSSLLGAPPGYKGYEKGGLLTEAIRRRPYSVVLLDEFEKAHENIQEVFLQVLDQGWTKDREGRYIDFRNAVLILTTNAASDLLLELYEDPSTRPTKVEKVVDSIRAQLRDHFSDPLLGRLALIPYYPLSKEVLGSITDLKLKKIQRRLKQVHDVDLVWHDSVRVHVVDQCSARETGGRMIDGIVNNTLLPEISREVLSRLLGDTRIASITVRFVSSEFTYEYAERSEAAS